MCKYIEIKFVTGSDGFLFTFFTCISTNVMYVLRTDYDHYDQSIFWMNNIYFWNRLGGGNPGSTTIDSYLEEQCYSSPSCNANLVREQK